MNLDYLRTLISIVEEGNLSAAARARHISQPAVTKQLQRLEADLGLPLLLRGPRRQVELTPAGELAVAFARQTLARLEALEKELGALKVVGQGTLVLAASTIPAEYVLPSLLADFHREYPAVKVEMSVSDSAEVAEKLLADKADVGMVGSRVPGAGLRLERLLGDEIVLVVPLDHAFARRKRVGLEELRGQPLVLREEGSGTRHSVDVSLATAGLELPQEDVVLVLGSTQAVLRAVEQGLGLGFVSARAAATRQGRSLACIGLDGVDLGRDLYLAYLPERVGDPLVAHFLEFARHQLANQAP
jgi:DNA-binding transcriptional LysR family regulator